MATKKNVIVGAASVFIGPSQQTSAPAATGATPFRTTMAAAPAVALGWRDVGYTQDGLEVSNDPSYTDIEVDQLLDAVKVFQDGMSVTLATTFAEATLENLLVAWGQAAATLTSTSSDKTWLIDGGALGSQPLERGLIAVGPGPEIVGANTYSERTYHAFRVMSVDASSTTLARADATVVPVSFRALPDDYGKYGIVRDRSIALA